MSINLREARSIIRKAKRRVVQGESVSHINLTAMMDMMTILLVFMIQSLSMTASPLNIPVSLPPSTTDLPEPEASKTVTIARDSILVEGVPILKVENGDVDASERKEGQFGVEITKLRTSLSDHHEGLYQLAALSGQEPRHELTIVADKEIPYKLLYSVMSTAGQASAKNHPDGPGFQKYRLIVIKNEVQ
jgi:biopolymer transport protein ExbD